MNRKIYFNNQNLHITNAIEEDSTLKILGTAAHFGTANLNGEIVDDELEKVFSDLKQDYKEV